MEDSTISEGSDTETETEMPLSSQEDYTFMKTIQPDLSDDINSVLKQEQSDDDVEGGNTYWKTGARVHKNVKHFTPNGKTRPPSDGESPIAPKSEIPLTGRCPLTGATCSQVVSVVTRPGGSLTSPTSVLMRRTCSPPPILPQSQSLHQHQEQPQQLPSDSNSYATREPTCSPVSPQPSGRCPVAGAMCTQVASVVTHPGGTLSSPTSVLLRRTCSPPPMPPPNLSLRPHQEQPYQPPPDSNSYAIREPIITCSPASPQSSVEPPNKRSKDMSWTVQYYERESNNHYRNQPGYAPSYPLGESPQLKVCQEGQVSSTSAGYIQDVNTVPVGQLSVTGKYVFSMEYEAENTKPAKSCNYTFSPLLSKVFAQIDKGVPVKFATELPVPAQNVEIRAYLVYKDIHSREVIVNRCPHHVIRQDQISFNPHHVMDTVGDKNMHVEHTQCPSTRRYVTILKPAVTNSNHMINSFCANLRFRCASSCRGGIDRRPIMALFEFYINDQFHGRASIEVSICSSPGRDRTNQEEKLMRIMHPELYINRADDDNEERVALEMRDTYFSAKGILKEGRSFEDDTFLIRVKGAQNAELVGRLAKQLNELREGKSKNKRAISVISSNSPSPAPTQEG